MMSSNDPGANVVRLESTEPEEPVGTSDDVTEAIDVPEPSAAEPRQRRRLLRLPRLPRIGVSRVGLGVWLGLLVAALGFGLIAFTWGKVAGLIDVSAQLPYFVSGGLVGLGLILVGLVGINLSVKHKEALDRKRQLEEVRDALVSLRSSIESAERDDDT